MNVTILVMKFVSPIRDLIQTLSHNKAYTLGIPVPPFPQMPEFLDWSVRPSQEETAMMFPSANSGRERISTMDLLATFAALISG